MPQTGPWTGDPVWLADVLRAEGVNVVEYPGWRNRGHGDFKDIRGVMVHHTGSDTASATSIADGRRDLSGPLSQLHIARDGTVTVVAVGVAWHAGVGMYPWLPTNMGNWHLIGIECANSGTSPTAPHRMAYRMTVRSIPEACPTVAGERHCGSLIASRSANSRSRPPAPPGVPSARGGASQRCSCSVGCSPSYRGECRR